MIQYTIDVGQLLVSILVFLLCIIGWFIKRDITQFGKRLDKHEDRMLQLSNTLSTVVGQVGMLSRFLSDKMNNERTE